jgi:phosphoglycerol transferase
MTFNRCAINDKNILLIAIMLAMAIFLIFRNFGLFPFVMDDEYLYSKFSRLLPMNMAAFPDYIYYVVYRKTSLCGDKFLDCARILNVIFFVSATPFIYFIGSRITGKNTALLVSVLSLLAPINVYTAFFMPESMYYFSFWGFTWFFFRTIQHRSIPQWALLGIIYGATSLIKPHAIFLLPAFVCLFLVFSRQSKDGGGIVKMLAPYCAFISLAIAIKFLVGYMFAGKSGITVFGPSYSKNASNFILDPSKYLSFIRLALENLKGHLLALCLLFSVPVAQNYLAVRHFYQKSSEKILGNRDRK